MKKYYGLNCGPKNEATAKYSRVSNRGPGSFIIFSPNANRVVDLKQSRLLFFSKNVHRVAIKQRRLLDLLYSFFPKMYTESYCPFQRVGCKAVIFSRSIILLGFK